jgi:hypothetical protein
MSTAMIAMTTNSSINVKADTRRRGEGWEPTIATALHEGKGYVTRNRRRF